MNTFEQLIGRQILKVIKVEIRDDYPCMGECLAIFLMLEENSGLVIFFDSYHNTTTVDYMTLEQLMDEYGTEWSESCLIETESTDRINSITGQTLKSIRIPQSEKEIIVGDNFVIRDGKYPRVIIKTTSEKLTLFATIDGGQVSYDTEELPGKQEGWTF